MTTETPPNLSLDPDNLNSDGFTASGEARFKDTIKDYSDTVYKKSVNYGELDKASNMPREITHDHVKSAAHSIAQSYGKNKPTKIQKFSQVVEYIAIAMGGAGTSHLDKTYGVIACVVGAILAVLFFSYRVFGRGE